MWFSPVVETIVETRQGAAEPGELHRCSYQHLWITVWITRGGIGPDGLADAGERAYMKGAPRPQDRSRRARGGGCQRHLVVIKNPPMIMAKPTTRFQLPMPGTGKSVCVR